MTRRFREMVLSALALGALMTAGCGPSTTNEENLDKTQAPSTSGGAVVKYGDFAKKQSEKDAQARKEAQEAKKSSKAKPKTPEAPPQSQ